MIVELELIIDQLSVFDCHSFPELLGCVWDWGGELQIDRYMVGVQNVNLNGIDRYAHDCFQHIAWLVCSFVECKNNTMFS